MGTATLNIQNVFFPTRKLQKTNNSATAPFGGRERKGSRSQDYVTLVQARNHHDEYERTHLERRKMTAEASLLERVHGNDSEQKQLISAKK